MEINKIKRLVLILLMSFAAIGAQAQLEQAVKKIFAGDSITGVHASMKQESDSAYVAKFAKDIGDCPGLMRRICGWRWNR